MGTAIANDLMVDVTKYQYNPSAIQQSVLKKLSEATDGTLIVVDPTNPFVFALESAAVLTSAAMTKNESNTRKQYPYLAQTQDELYLHMSDTDYLNRFATPSTTVFSLLLSLNEILDKMVLDPVTGTKKIVIPRNSYFTVANISFSIQYPIEIRQLAHGGLQVVYDASIVSPLQTLSSNIIKYEIKQNVDGKYIYFEFDVQQFNIISHVGALDASIDFSLDVPFTDLYYYTRVFVEDDKGNWNEIKTTHSEQVYDIATPTAVLNVVNNSVNISIPQIYTATGILNKGIRVDVYETKGALDIVLWEYPFTAFNAVWQVLDPNDATEFVAPLNTISIAVPFCNAAVTSGKNGMSFMDLRTKVINNAIGAPSLPITNAQITNMLNVAGYDIVKNIDNITNRSFLATKGMPAPIDASLITPASSGISTIVTTIKDLLQINTVIDNGNSITITPNTLYQSINGVVKPLTNDQLNTLLALPNNSLATEVTQKEYFYTPFHYVVDMNINELNVRPYYLDNPDITTKLFVDENDTTLLQVNTDSFTIKRTPTGYSLSVITLTSDTYKNLPDNEVFAQLSFIPEGERDYAYVNGTLSGTTNTSERIFTFDLSTNFNVNSTDHLQLTKFLMYTTQPRLTGVGLLTDFNITYSTTAPMGNQWVASEVGKFILPADVVGITHEVLRVKFGDALPTMWARSRSIISSVTYKKWAVDVIRTYDKDVYATDANGSVITFDSNNNIVTTLLHSKGDLVIDALGNPVFIHKAGDTVYDSLGNPIILDVRDMLRQIDIMLIEGVYWFANDITATNYRTLINKNLIEWLTVDLANLKTKLLENTEIFFYPNGTLGTIRSLVDNGIIGNINAGQSFNVDLSVSTTVFNDNTLRDQLTKTTIATIRDQLNKVTVSLDSITTALRAQYSADVISILVSGLGGANNYSVVSILEDSKRCSIRKRLTALPNNSIIVEEDINVNFILYKLN
jgi:hypothetical protein